MSNWDRVRVNLGRAANKAVKKTGEAADIASLYVKLKTAQAKLDGHYTALGKLTYKQLKTGESQAEKIAPVVEGIDKLQDKIHALIRDLETEKKRRKMTETEIVLENAVEEMNAANAEKNNKDA